MRLICLVALVLVAAACGSDNSPTSANSAAKSVACATGSLSVGATKNGDLDSASTCKRVSPIANDSTLTSLYALNVQSGHGYLLTMTGPSLNSVMALVSPGDTLRALSPTYAGPLSIARMLIASEVTETDTVHATTFDTLASDTGAYTLTTQACKVPVPPLVQPTDSITHTDTISVGGDCPVFLSDFVGNKNGEQVFVHLYSLHYSQRGVFRQVTVDASSPVWLLMGGPEDDAFGAIAGLSSVSSFDSATTHNVGDFGTGQGHYTLVVAATAPTSYTLTIGTEQPYSSVTRFSRSRSRPLVVQHQSTPPSGGRRGR